MSFDSWKIPVNHLSRKRWKMVFSNVVHFFQPKRHSLNISVRDYGHRVQFTFLYFKDMMWDNCTHRSLLLQCLGITSGVWQEQWLFFSKGGVVQCTYCLEKSRTQSVIFAIYYCNINSNELWNTLTYLYFNIPWGKV